MSEVPETEHGASPSIDSAMAKMLSAFSENTSRRGVLATGGRWLLRLLGVNAAMMILLPLDRCGGADNPNCPGGSWANCGQWGAFCTACCGSGANPSSCPSCTTGGGWWTTCCCCDTCAPGGYNVMYQDCCDSRGTGGTTSQSCTGQWCAGSSGVRQPYWCGHGWGQDYYRCTIAIITATPCTNCNQQLGNYYPA